MLFTILNTLQYKNTIFLSIVQLLDFRQNLFKVIYLLTLLFHQIILYLHLILLAVSYYYHFLVLLVHMNKSDFHSFYLHYCRFQFISSHLFSTTIIYFFVSLYSFCSFFMHALLHPILLSYNVIFHPILPSNNCTYSFTLFFHPIIVLHSILPSYT